MCDRKRAHPPPLGMLNQEVGQGKRDFPSHPRGDLTLTLSSFNRSPHLIENSGLFLRPKIKTFMEQAIRCLQVLLRCIFATFSQKYYADYDSNSTYVRRNKSPKL